MRLQLPTSLCSFHSPNPLPSHPPHSPPQDCSQGWQWPCSVPQTFLSPAAWVLTSFVVPVPQSLLICGDPQGPTHASWGISHTPMLMVFSNMQIIPKFKSWDCVRGPQGHLIIRDSLECTTLSASCVYSWDLLQRHREDSGQIVRTEIQVGPEESPWGFPVLIPPHYQGSHRAHSSPNTCLWGVSPGKPSRGSELRAVPGGCSQRCPLTHTPTFQTLRRRTGVQHKPHGLHK